MELQNANPTIINLSDLPTRRRDKTYRLKNEIRTARRPGQSVATLTPFDSDLPWDGPFQRHGSHGILGSLTDVGTQHQPLDEFDADDGGDPIDEQEIFDLISTISDPEHPLTLGQLAVVNLADIHIDPPPTPGKGPDLDTLTTVTVELTPTVNHCSLATIIGLAVRVRLDACLPPNYRLDVRAKEGAHDQDDQITKQLADKERVAAALENDTLRQSLDTMMATCVSAYGSGEEAD